MANKKHSASSGRWLKEHFDDKYVHEAQKKVIAHALSLNWKKSSKKIAS